MVGARRASALTLLDAAATSRRGRADRLGSKIFRELAAGPRLPRARGAAARRRRFAVLRRGENPPAAFYRGKRLKQGLNYVEVRDGVELAMTVRLPPGKTLADGPFPTVVEYSGYPIARAGRPARVGRRRRSAAAAEPDPLAPATSTVVGSVIAPLLGFAVVSVQMRGSGCSGGEFDLFDLPTTYDGYDAIETVAAQPWVKGGKVGMVGISFSGITQLFTAGTRPPHLAAITPLSVADDTYSATGPRRHPQHRLLAHVARRPQDDARPAPGGGQEWARVLVRRGDRHCRDNQRAAAADPGRASRSSSANPFRDAARSTTTGRPAAWMGRIEVPTFLVGQFQDEQTSGHFATSLGRAREQPARVDHAAERRPRRLARARHDDPLGRVPEALRRRRGPDDPRPDPRR